MPVTDPDNFSKVKINNKSQNSKTKLLVFLLSDRRIRIQWLIRIRIDTSDYSIRIHAGGAKDVDPDPQYCFVPCCES
jgi:hypothetical protein